MKKQLEVHSVCFHCLYSSVLIDYHNNLLSLLERETNDNDNHAFGHLKNLVNNLVSKEVSILQIVHDNTGVITLTNDDCSWIEELARANLINENDEYFQRADTQFNFNFLYLQSYIVRTYLLFCRINYRHIIQNYQCHVRRTTTTTDSEILDLDEKYLVPLNREQLETEWNHLKDMHLDNLYHGHNLLRQIAVMLKHHQDDVSQRNLYEYIQSFGEQNNILEQIQHCAIKDFQICHLGHIRQLYADSISDFQHLFTDVSQLLRIPIDHQLDEELNQTLRAAIISVEDVDNMRSTIKTITDLLNDLRAIEQLLVGQSAHSLKETCRILHLENSILDLIPSEIKCENYVTISIHLIRMRTILQEQVVNIEASEIKQWDENFDVQVRQQQPNCFLNLLDQSPITNEIPENIDDDYDVWSNLSYEVNAKPIEDILLDINDPLQLRPLPTNECTSYFEYSSLFELHIKFVQLTSSVLFEQIRKKNEQPLSQATSLNKAQVFIVNDPGEKSHRHLWKSENLFDRLREFFDKNYDRNRYAVIDKNEIFVDFTNRNARLPHQIPLEYSIIERTLLFSIQFNFRGNLFEYLVTPKGNIFIVIDRFISDNNITFSSNDTYLCFFDEHGKSVENGTIADLVNQTDNIRDRTISITVIEENSKTTQLCEITLKTKNSKNF